MALIMLVLMVLEVLRATAAFSISDSECSSESIDAANQAEVHKLLKELTSTTALKFVRFDRERPCQFWEAESQCHGSGCSVYECPQQDIPAGWKDGTNIEVVPDFEKSSDSDDEWIVQDTELRKLTYVDLSMNPEGYTGYKGEGARKVWMAVYGENCFKDQYGMCYEERVFYRILSGFQGCTSAHIAYNHPIGDGVEWGPNLELFNRLVGSFPDRIENIYFTFVFLLRAVKRVSPILLDFNIDTGNTEDDSLTHSIMKRLLSTTIIDQCSPEFSFDENLMFRQPNNVSIKAQLTEHFRNISLIMDCVLCDKCKLHAKLQVLGIGTALKCMFSEVKALTRNEVVALMNSLSKFSHAVFIISQLQKMSAVSRLPIFLVIVCVAIVLSWIVCIATMRMWIHSPRRLKQD